MNKRIFFILLLTAFVNGNLYAQKSFFDFGLRDTLYIKDFEKQYNIQFSTWYNRFSFFIDPPFFSNNSNKLKLTPNLKPQLGISLGLKYFSISFSVAAPLQLPGREKYGQTNYFDFTASYYKGYIGLETYFSNYEGLYETSTQTGLKLRSNAGLFVVGLNGYYTINHKKYSFRSCLKNQELQYKSAGSPVLMAAIGLKSVNADTPLVEGTFRNPATFKAFKNSFGLGVLHFSLRPGYAYNFSIKKGIYFVAPAIFAGAGYSRVFIIKNNQEVQVNSMDFDLHTKVAFGYNHHKYYWNIYGVYDVTLNRILPNTNTSFNNFFLGFNVGYRFKNLISKFKWL
ncbi:MAG: DUF4421 family protein [Bacteroidia bacterium]|nr:DUF4421 family protein [Bacteroidia bacterium]